MTAGVAVHASCVVVGETGILLRGPSGSGKSTLARRIVEAAAASGRFARLVGDDRVLVSVEGGRLVARPHAAIAGLVEVRGLGILPAEAEPACVVGLVVELGSERGERLPPEGAVTNAGLGVALPVLQAAPDEADRVLLALRARCTA